MLGTLFSSLHDMLKLITAALPVQVRETRALFPGGSRDSAHTLGDIQGVVDGALKKTLSSGVFPVNATPQLLGSFTAALLVQETVLNLGASPASHDEVRVSLPSLGSHVYVPSLVDSDTDRC